MQIRLIPFPLRNNNYKCVFQRKLFLTIFAVKSIYYKSTNFTIQQNKNHYESSTL
jgi:hypothetical protein